MGLKAYKHRPITNEAIPVPPVPKPVPLPTITLANEGLVTRAQLAREVAVSEQTIALWEKDGLPVLSIGAQRLYDVKKVAKWIRDTGSR